MGITDTLPPFAYKLCGFLRLKPPRSLTITDKNLFMLTLSGDHELGQLSLSCAPVAHDFFLKQAWKEQLFYSSCFFHYQSAPIVT